MVSVLLKKLYEVAERSTPAIVNDSDDGKFFRITAGNPLHETFVRDQLDSNRSVTDLHLVGEDGHVPVHRYILMASSSFLKNLLENHDPSELAVVHLPEVKLNQIIQIVSLVYAGKAVIQRNDQFHLFSVMKTLGISTENFQFRSRKPIDDVLIPNFRYYKREDEEEDEMEETFVNEALIDDAILTKPQDNSITGSAPSDSATKAVVVDKENVNGNRAICEKEGPKVVNRSTIEKAESDKYSNLKVELPGENSENDEEFPCLSCNEEFNSEKSLFLHLVMNCASHLRSKLEFKGRQCLVCKVKFPSHNIFGLIKHVEGCQGKRRVGHSSSDENCNDVEQSESLNDAVLPSSHINVSLNSIDEDDDTPNQSQELTSEENSPIKLKKKRRRRRVAAYNLPKRKPKKRPAKPPNDAESDVYVIDVKAMEMDFINSRLSRPSDNEEDEETTVGADSIEDQEEEPSRVFMVGEDDEDKTEINLNARPPNPNILLERFGLKNVADILKMLPENLRALFRTCSICGEKFKKLKDASKCLRAHGCRLCFVCLQVLPNLSNEIDVHTAKEHQTWETNPGKVNCPLCFKEFEYKLGLPSHVGNFKCTLLSNPDVEDTVEIPEPAAPDFNLEDSNLKDDTVRTEEVLPSSSSSTPHKVILPDLSTPAPVEPSEPSKLVGQDEDSSNPISLLASTPLSKAQEQTTHNGSEEKEKQILEIDTENHKEVQNCGNCDKIKATNPRLSSCKEPRTTSLIPIKRRAGRLSPEITIAASTINPIIPLKNLREGRRSFSQEGQQQTATVTTSNESVTEMNPPGQANTNSESGQEGEPPGIPSGSRFLMRREINGEFFNIYCNIDNPKKRIAIPVTKSVEDS